MSTKIALFLSATLTAFALAVLFGVVTRLSSAQAPVAEVAPATQVTAVSLVSEQPAPTTPAPLSPDQAATLAAAAINRQDVYSVETSVYQGLDCYRVVFSSGAVVSIGLDKQVLAISTLQSVAASPSPTQAPITTVLGAKLPIQPTWGREHDNHHD